MSFDDHFGIKSDQKYAEEIKQGTNKTSVDDSFIDQKFFGSIDDLIKTHSTPHSKKVKPSENIPTNASHSTQKKSMNVNDDGNYIESQYFGSLNLAHPIPPKNTSASKFPKKNGRNDLAFIDQEYFSGINDKRNPVLKDPLKMPFKPDQQKGPNAGNERINLNKRWIDDSAPEILSNVKSNMSAKEFAEQLRQKENLNPHLTPVVKSKVDSEGFRIPSERKYLFEHMTREEVVNLLLKCVLTDKNDVVAINKPYGLPTQGGPGHPFNIADLLPELAARLKLNEDLRIVHRLDKETTGVMLLAKTKPMAHILKEAFNKSWIMKTYLCVTIRTPQPSEGLIDIPLKFVDVGEKGLRKTMLRPRYNNEHSEYSDIMNHYGSSGADRALTYYNVLNSSKTAALVQCHSLTGVKHQIRAHMSMAVNSPILGDHKYSHSSSLAPQRLPMDILKRLNIRQSKVRYMSLHLHAQRLVLDPYMDDLLLKLAKENLRDFTPPPKDIPRLNFFAPLPNFFMDNLRRLNLKDIHKAFKLIGSRVI